MITGWRFYVPDHGETAADATDLPGVRNWFQPGEVYRPPVDVREAATHAAEWCWGHRDGWEWGWPVTFVVIDPQGVEHRRQVSVEHVPHFYAEEVRDAQPR